MLNLHQIKADLLNFEYNLKDNSHFVFNCKSCDFSMVILWRFLNTIDYLYQI